MNTDKDRRQEVRRNKGYIYLYRPTKTPRPRSPKPEIENNSFHVKIELVSAAAKLFLVLMDGW